MTAGGRPCSAAPAWSRTQHGEKGSSELGGLEDGVDWTSPWHGTGTQTEILIIPPPRTAISTKLATCLAPSIEISGLLGSPPFCYMNRPIKTVIVMNNGRGFNMVLLISLFVVAKLVSLIMLSVLYLQHC